MPLLREWPNDNALPSRRKLNQSDAQGKSVPNVTDVIARNAHATQCVCHLGSDKESHV